MTTLIPATALAHDCGCVIELLLFWHVPAISQVSPAPEETKHGHAYDYEQQFHISPENVARRLSPLRPRVLTHVIVM